MLDKWITTLAKKDFSETINWIEGSIVATLGLLLATAIFLDTTPITVTVPAQSIDTHRILIDQNYRDVLIKEDTLTLHYQHQTLFVKIIDHNFNSASKFTLTTLQPIPTRTDFRIVIGKRSILDMLLKSKASEPF